MNNRERVQARRKAGLCIDCPEPAQLALPGKDRCQVHQEKHLARCKANYDKNKDRYKAEYAVKVKDGKCPHKSCDQSRSEESVYCLKHLKSQRTRQKKMAVKKAEAEQQTDAALRKKRKKVGVCLDCGGERFSKWRCRVCYARYLFGKKSWTFYAARKEAGLCRYCDNVIEGGAARCQACAEKRKEKYAAAQQSGICTCCGGPQDNPQSKRLCLACGKKERKNTRKRKADRKAAGICVGCGDRQPHENDDRCLRCIHRDRSKDRKKYRKLRDAVFAAYGGKCQCHGCNADTPEFLQVDHVNNDGAAHRKEIGGNGSVRLYTWLRKHGFPQEGFQLLCGNCHNAKSHRGGCPCAGRSHN